MIFFFSPFVVCLCVSVNVEKKNEREEGSEGGGGERKISRGIIVILFCISLVQFATRERERRKKKCI